MRATLTVVASEGPNKPCKVTVKLWGIARKQLRQVAAECDNHNGSVHRRAILDDAVDVVCNFDERSLTLVKPASDIHGLQARFEALVGKSLAYRITSTQDRARKLAAADDLTPQEGNLEGCSVDQIFAAILGATRAAAQPATRSTAKQRKPKRRGRPRTAAA